MTALSTPPTETIKSLQRLLREGYRTRFELLKELLQNADDAGARRFKAMACPGFADATNPLLRAPSLIVANDGRVEAKHLDAMRQASGGSKAGEASTVGRFGLGQKSVFHLCDAFVVQAWLEDCGTRRSDVINPFEALPGATAAHTLWKELDASDQACVEAWAKDHGFAERGVVLVLPLRSPALRPGLAELADDAGTGAEEIGRMRESDALAATLSCMRSLERIELGDDVLTIGLTPARLAGPDDREPHGTLGVRIVLHGADATMTGRQTRVPHGAAVALKQRDDWPKTFTIERRQENEEAEPHGAVMIVRRSREGAATLRIRWTAYLPVGDALHTTTLENSTHDIDLLLHGHFFPRSDRTAIGFGEDIRGQWNSALRDEAILPLLLPALAEAMPELSGEGERRAVLAALRGWADWEIHKAAACSHTALGLGWDGAGKPTWRVEDTKRLRPVPAQLSVEQVRAAWPDVSTWLSQRDLSLVFGESLSAERIAWDDAELGKLVTSVGVAAFSRGRAPATLATLLEHNRPLGPETRSALADTLRAAVRNEENFASDDEMRRLVALLDRSTLLRLPATVTHNAVLRPLGGATSLIPVKAGWIDDTGDAPLDSTLTIALLTALEPLLDERSLAEQAGAVINHLLRSGVTPASLATNTRAQSLRVIPAIRVRDGEPTRMTISEAVAMARDGLLFASGVRGKELTGLADGVLEPAVHQLSNALAGTFGDMATSSNRQHLLRVVQQATRFGREAERGSLAVLLREVGDPAALRMLVSGQPDLPPTAKLCEAGDVDPSLVALLAQQRQAERELVIVPPAVLTTMGDAQKRAIGIERLDATWLARALREASDRGDLPMLEHAQAMALLASGIDADLLRPLPLHRGDDGALHPAGALVRGNAGDIPASLRPHIRLLDLWPDQRAVARQNELVARWSPARQVTVALATAEPWRFAEEIAAAATDAAELDDDVRASLHAARWLPMELPAAPADLLDLGDEEAAALRALPDGASLPTLADRPQAIRPQERVDALRRHGALLDRVESLRFAADIARQSTTVGMARGGDVADWRVLAKERAALPAPGWALYAAVLRGGVDEDATIIADVLAPPDADGLVAQLNALAGLARPGQAGEAARRLHQAITAGHVALLAPDGWLPSELLIPSGAGQFHRADELALHAEGIARNRRVHDEYRALLPKQTARVAAAGDMEVGDAAADFADAVDGHLQRRHMVLQPEAALFILALLGRDARMAAYAARWRGAESFEQVCNRIDAALETTTGDAHYLPGRLKKIRWSLLESKAGQAPVQSAAGCTVSVPLAGAGAWLIEYRRSEQRVGPLVVAEHVTLVVSSDVPDRDMIESGLIQQFVHTLLPPLHLRHGGRSEPLEVLLDKVRDGQETLTDLREELRDMIADRLAQLRHAPLTKAARDRYHAAPKAKREAAREALWTFAQSAEAAPELLAAVRGKIGDMGYGDDRVLFELFQNADDAYVWQPREDADFRVRTQRDGDGVTHLAIVHRGRPINTAGTRNGGAPGHRRDLANMIAIGHSEKDGATQTGRFGLGFKTVHMLSDRAGIASGTIATRISGGMIPLPWPEGITAAGAFRSEGSHDRPTLIDLPIAAGREDAAGQAVDAFAAAAPWLAAIAPHIRCIDIDGVRHSAKFSTLGEHIRVATLSNGRRMLELELNDGFRLFLAFGSNGPESFGPAVPQFWHLVPLIGMARRGDWLIEGRFAVDPGRTKLNGSIDEQRAQFARLSGAIGDRLIALHDRIGGCDGWRGFAAAYGLAPDGCTEFWRRLVLSLAKDLADGPEAALHDGGGGLTRLLRERPLVPLADGGLARAGDVGWELTGALSDPAISAIVRRWPGAEAVIAATVASEFAATLAGISVSPGKLSLNSMLARSFPDRLMTPAAAAVIGPLVTADMLARLSKEEEAQLRLFLREALWLAEDDSRQPIRQLGFPQSERETERLRAEIAPSSGRLASPYTQDAYAAAFFAREQAGHTPDVWRAWVRGAGASEGRKRALLQFLVQQDRDTIRDMLAAAEWLPPLDEWDLLRETPGHATILAAMDTATSESEPAEPNDTWQSGRPDPQAALQAIGDWWDAYRARLVPKYDQAVYPEGFRPSRDLLRGDDEAAADAAWFTMLALASFQTLGRVQPEQSREFLTRCMRENWWRDLALVHHDDVLEPFYKPLKRWSEPESDEQFMIWRRSLIDLCRIARYLPDYRKIFVKLPALIRHDGPVRLGNLLDPLNSAAAAKLNVNAPSIVRALGTGANWVIRELSRHEVYTLDEADKVAPYGWSSVARVRRLIERLGGPSLSGGMDMSREVHRWVADTGGDDPLARFGRDTDLALQIITTREHLGALAGIMREASAYGWNASDADDE